MKINSLIIVSIRFIWLERNKRVLENDASTGTYIRSQTHAEFALWKLVHMDRMCREWSGVLVVCEAQCKKKKNMLQACSKIARP